MYRFEYLIYSLIFVLLLAGILLVRADLRRHMAGIVLLGALAGTVSELVYFQDYWRPPTLLGVAVPGLEDALFGGAVVGLGVSIYPFLTRQRPVKQYRKQLWVIWIALAGFLGVVPLAWLLGLDSVVATIGSCVCLCAWLLIRRPDLLMPALLSGIFLASVASIIYGAGLLTTGVHFGYGGDVWLLDHTAIGGALFGRIRYTEVGWFFTMGAFLAAAYPYARGTCFEPLKDGSEMKQYSH